MSLKETVQGLLDETSDHILEQAFFHEGISDEWALDDEDDQDSVDGVSKSLGEAGIAFECVEQEGGEGEGDQYWTVYKFTKGSDEVFVKFAGWYASYHGSEMNDYKIVTPKKVEITVYD
jgi:hypothetical protein